MAERTVDLNRSFVYRAAQPVQNRRVHPSLVPAGEYVRLTGIDGRFAGSFRRFPGFIDTLDLKTIDVATTNDANAISNVWFFKHISVQAPKFLYWNPHNANGTDPVNDTDFNNSPVSDWDAHAKGKFDVDNATYPSGQPLVLRGFVVAHDYKDSTDSDAVKGVLRFVYWDPKASAWRSQILLREVKTLVDARWDVSTDHAQFGTGGSFINSTSEYDAVAMGPFIYFCVNRGTIADENSIENGELIPGDFYRRSVRVESKPDSFQWKFTQFGPLTSPATKVDPTVTPIATATTGLDGEFHSNSRVRVSARMFSDLKNVAGPLYLIGQGNCSADDDVLDIELLTGQLVEYPSTEWPISLSAIDLVTNGDFTSDLSSWVAGAGWAFDAGRARATSATSSLTQTGILEVGKWYRVVLTTADITGGQLHVESGTPNGDMEGGFHTPIDISGTHVIVFKALSVDFTLRGDNYSGTVDNVIINEATCLHTSNDDRLMGPRIRGYRSIDSHWFETTGVDIPGLIGGTIFRETSFTIGYEGTAPTDATLKSLANYGLAAKEHSSETGLRLRFGLTADVSLTTLARLDPFKDDNAEAPEKLRLLAGYQGTLLRIGTMPLAGEPAVTVDREEILSWGSLVRYAPEQCRITDATPLGSVQDERILTMVTAGDYAFAIGDSAIYRVHRNGSLLGINEVQTLVGGVGRYAAVGVGSALYFVGSTGLYVVDGATNEFQLVTSVDRIIQEDWRGSLGSIHMAYDQRLGALIVLNETRDEAILLWQNTGLTTNLEDVSFKFGTQGIDPETAGAARSFWIDSDGDIMTPNAEREDDTAQTMVGGARAVGSVQVAWNAGFASGSTPTVLKVPLTWKLVSQMAGAKIYFLSGGLNGTSATIATVDTVTNEITLTEAVSDPPASGDRYSIAPIVYEVIGWPIQDERIGPEVFIRKVIRAMRHHVLLLDGHTTNSGAFANVNLLMQHRMYKRGLLTATDILQTSEAQMSSDPTKNASSIPQAGSTLIPAWRQLASDLDFELLSGRVDGTVTMSGSESSPSTAYN